MARLIRTGAEMAIPRKNFLAGAAMTVAAAGCGGGTFNTAGGSASDGRMAIEIIWPERRPSTRVIPLAAESMVFNIETLEAPWLDRKVTGRTNRPANGKSVVVIKELPECKMRVEVLAYPEPDGGGAPLGIATQVVTLSATKPTVTVNFQMSSTVARLEIQDDMTEIEVIQSLTKRIVPSAFNAAGELLLLFPPPQNWKFSVGNSSIAAVDANGNVTGIKEGTTTLTIQAVEPNGAGNPVVVKQRVYPLKVVSSRVAILGTPKPNPDGSQDPPGLYWQSLTSDARQLLVRTTGDHYVVHINPEQTKLLFVAKVVHADRTDSRSRAYIINTDGTGLRQIMPQSDNWSRWYMSCYMKGGFVATAAIPDGTNDTSGIYVCNDDGSDFRLLHQIDSIEGLVATPQGEDAYVFGHHEWEYKVNDEVRKLPVTTWWLVDDVRIYSPAQVETYIRDRPNLPMIFQYYVVKNMYRPIVLDVAHWIALCEPLTKWGVNQLEYGRSAFWEYKHDDSTEPDTKYVELLCESLEVRGSNPRSCVTRDGRVIAVMDMQSPSLGMTNPDVLYLYNGVAKSVTATVAAKNWNSIVSFAVVNQS
jgi:hypothetical protein